VAAFTIIRVLSAYAGTSDLEELWLIPLSLEKFDELRQDPQEHIMDFLEANGIKLGRALNDAEGNRILHQTSRVLTKAGHTVDVDVTSSD
jgi:hypothetical protein